MTAICDLIKIRRYNKRAPTNMKKYWGSQTITGDIRQLKANNFKELSTNFFENGVPCAYTREEYNALPAEEKKAIKLGAYITACSFKEGSTKRNDANADKLHLVILDIDKTAEARAIIALKDSIKDQMVGLNYLIHTTISHTEEAPRLRALVELEECELDNRVAATRYVATLLGLDPQTGYDSCSTVTSQAYFRPVAFTDDTTGSIISSCTTGEALDVDLIPEDFVEDVDFEIGYAYDGDLEFDDDLENVPIAGLKMKWVESALSKLDPDQEDESGNSYIPWFKICCALRHQFRTEDGAEMAFEIFNDWSSNGEKYAGREATYRKWRAFVPCPKNRRPTTIRSLFKRAIKAGWDYTEMAEQVQITFEEWLTQTDDKILLASEGLARIAAMPFKDENEIMQNHLISLLQAKMKKLGFAGVTSTDLKKQLKKEKVKAAPKEDTDDKPKWLQPWCFVGADNCFFNNINKSTLSPAAFNSIYSKELMDMTPEGQANLNGKPPIMPTDFANNVKCIPTVTSVTYDPSFGGDHTYLKIDGMDYVNRYRPPSVKGIKKDAKEAEEVFRQWLSWTVSDPTIEEHIVRMIAHAIQNPDKKCRVATLFHSEQGIGKSTFGDMLGHLFGVHNTNIVKAKELDSGYNSYAVDGHCILFEELHAAGQTRAAVSDSLKDVITNDFISVVEKYKNPIKVINKTIVFGFTNKIDAISLESSDRRFLCIKMKPTKDEIRQASNEGYFKKLSRLKHLPATEEEGYPSLVGGIVHFFNNYEVPEEYDPNAPAPETDFREHLIASSESPIKSDILDVIADDEHPLVADDVLCLNALKKGLEDYDASKSLAYWLRDLNYVAYKRGNTRTFSIGGKKTSVWYRPDNHDDTFGTPDEILRERAEQGNLDKLDDI